MFAVSADLKALNGLDAARDAMNGTA